MIDRPSSTRPFNTPLECGLRALFVLDALRGRPADLQRLVSYDYLLVHSGDVQNGPSSLHPAVPFRGSELLVKRDLINAGLNQMHSRELLKKSFDASGILYCATQLTSAFLVLLSTAYAAALRERADWVVNNFSDVADSELDAFMSQNIGRWGGDFERLTALQELEL